jgi:hypothetical protein
MLVTLRYNTNIGHKAHYLASVGNDNKPGRAAGLAGW